MSKQPRMREDGSAVLSNRAGRTRTQSANGVAPARTRRWVVAGALSVALLGIGAVVRQRLSAPLSRAGAGAPPEDSAETHLHRAVEAHPDDAAARIELGKYYEGKARPFEALWEYAEARRLAPTDPDLCLHLAVVLRAGRLPDLAAEQLSDALRAQPGHLEARQELADLHLATAEPERARALMLERRDLVWANAAAVVTLGRVCEAAGDDAGAAAAFQRALALDGKSDEALYRLGRLDLRQGKTDQARDAFFHAMFFDQVRPEYPFSAGMAYLRQGKPGDLKRAARFFKDALALRPNDAPAHYQLGVTLERLGQRSPALTHYSLATVADPTDAQPLAALSRGLAAVGNTTDAHRFMGRYYDLKDRPVDAVREYQRMAAVTPASAEPAALVGQVYLRTRQNGRAVAVTDAALKRHPDDEQLLERRAVLGINSGDWATARRMLQHWRAVQPKASRPLWLMGRCALGELKAPEAISWLEKAVAQEPRNPHYLGFLGGALLRSDRPESRERAAKVLAEAVELAPDEAEYLELYGQALQRRGQDEAARRQYLRALDADPSRIDAYLAVSQIARRLKRPAPGSLFAAAVRQVQQRESEETSLSTHVWWQPNDLASRLAFARFLCHTGHLARARDLLEPALAQPPTSAEARQLMEVVQRCLEAL